MGKGLLRVNIMTNDCAKCVTIGKFLGSNSCRSEDSKNSRHYKDNKNGYFVAGDSFINASFYILVSQSCVAAGGSLSTILSVSTIREGFEAANLSIK